MREYLGFMGPFGLCCLVAGAMLLAVDLPASGWFLVGNGLAHGTTAFLWLPRLGKEDRSE